MGEQGVHIRNIHMALGQHLQKLCKTRRLIRHGGDPNPVDADHVAVGGENVGGFLVIVHDEPHQAVIRGFSHGNGPQVDAVSCQQVG